MASHISGADPAWRRRSPLESYVRELLRDAERTGRRSSTRAAPPPPATDPLRPSRPLVAASDGGVKESDDAPGTSAATGTP